MKLESSIFAHSCSCLLLFSVVEGYVNDEIHQAESLNVKTQTWEPAPSLEMKEIWCRMIGLERSDEGINGAAESGQRMRLIPVLEKTNRFLEEAR
ncbi:hypothetical protein YC2023_097842 [Brassica napus]|uniref:(rape) hypothetical protein n=1 Tax=Brassica napus TaxID=3708 RepID=A0A816TTK0_BRANA|nr:unnamed protein product [Brassica napus]